MADTVNSRSIPTASDFKDTNENAELNSLNTLLTELANILDSTAGNAKIAPDGIVQAATSGSLATVSSLMTAATVGTSAVAGFMNVTVGGTEYEVPFYAKA